MVSGANGYVGGRLIPELLQRGYTVRAMVRDSGSVYAHRWPSAEIVEGDALKPETLKSPFAGVDTAYYLIHSLLREPKKASQLDLVAARNFRIAAEKAGVRRIIYLGSLGDVRSDLSEHVASRAAVGRELMSGTVPVTVLRTAMIVGVGSAAYEIMTSIVRKLPIVPVPSWCRGRCQPHAMRDVIRCLVGSLENDETTGRAYDIGGKDVRSYRELLQILATIENRKRIFITIPFGSVRLYSYILSLLTPVPMRIIAGLLDGLKDDLICQERSIEQILPWERRCFKSAILATKSREQSGALLTRWSDAHPRTGTGLLRLSDLSSPPEYVARYDIESEKPLEGLFRACCQLGGEAGWTCNNWMWRLRGFVDRMLLGVGTARGRKTSNILEVNEVIDFWRVEELRHNSRLLLRAEMKLPGHAWLEFDTSGSESKNTLSVTAYFKTSSLFGKIYWYFFVPFHAILFRGLLRRLERRV